MTYLKKNRTRFYGLLRYGLVLLALAGEMLPAQDYLLEIDFPEDAAAACGDLCIPAIRYVDEGCAMLLINRDTARFSASSDECYKLAITYDVIDWCLWDGEYAGALIRRRTEDEDNPLAIDRAVERSERPVLRLQGPNTANLGMTLDRRHNHQVSSICGNDDDGSQLPDNDLDYPTDDNESYRGDLYAGRWRYTQFVKVYDNEPPVVTVPPYGGPTETCPQLQARQFGDIFGNCDARVSFTFTAADACDLLDDSADDVVLLSAELDQYAADINGDDRIDANEFSVEADARTLITTSGVGEYHFTGTFPLMEPNQLQQWHTLRVQLGDGCGNRTSIYLPFQIIDCKGPAPSCVNGLTVTLMPLSAPADVDQDGIEDHCANQVYAAHVVASSSYDCTGQGPAVTDGLLEVHDYAVYSETQAAQPGFTPQVTQDSLFLTENLGDTVQVRVYAFDESGNYDYCSTYVRVEGRASCAVVGGGNLSGRIHTAYAVPIEGVEVAISGQVESWSETSAEGTYLLGNLPLGGDYTLTPSREEDVDNGVTTFDIVLINQHILGLDTLDSPYKLIAADVNHSGSITVRDIIQLRKVILGIDATFPDNTSWRFVPDDYVFPDPANPWLEEFPEVSSINDLEGSVELNFIGVKVGDVNQSARAYRQE
jgi:hypothetical protein